MCNAIIQNTNCVWRHSPDKRRLVLECFIQHLLKTLWNRITTKDKLLHYWQDGKQKGQTNKKYKWPKWIMMTQPPHQIEGAPSTRPQRRFWEVRHCQALAHQGPPNRLAGSPTHHTHRRMAPQTHQRGHRDRQTRHCATGHRLFSSATCGDQYYRLKDLLYPKSTTPHQTEGSPIS